MQWIKNNDTSYQFYTLEDYKDGCYVIIAYDTYNPKRWAVNWPRALRNIYCDLYPASSDNTVYPYNFELTEIESFKLHVEKFYFKMRKLIVFT